MSIDRVAVPDHLAHPVANDAVAARRLVGRLVVAGLVGVGGPRRRTCPWRPSASFHSLLNVAGLRPAMCSSACLRALPLTASSAFGDTAALISSLGVLAAPDGFLGIVWRVRLRALAAPAGLRQPLFMRHRGEADATDRSARAPRACSRCVAPCAWL